MGPSHGGPGAQAMEVLVSLGPVSVHVLGRAYSLLCALLYVFMIVEE